MHLLSHSRYILSEQLSQFLVEKLLWKAFLSCVAHEMKDVTVTLLSILEGRYAMSSVLR